MLSRLRPRFAPRALVISFWPIGFRLLAWPLSGGDGSPLSPGAVVGVSSAVVLNRLLVDPKSAGTLDRSQL